MTEFLKSLLIDALPGRPKRVEELSPEEEEGFLNSLDAMQDCEYCGEPSEYLVEVDDSDPSVGYRSTLTICPKCQTKRDLFRRNHY